MSGCDTLALGVCETWVSHDHDVRGRGLSWSRATKRFFLGVPLLPLSGLESCARLSHRKDPGSRGMSAWCSVRVARLAGARQWFGGSSLSVSGAKAGARSCTSLSGTATRTLQYDLCIIGGGSAGEHSGRSLQALALQVVELGLQFLHPPLTHPLLLSGSTLLRTRPYSCRHRWCCEGVGPREKGLRD